MGGFSNSILGGAQKLIRAAIQSPNFVSGVSGWIVRKDGTSEFDSITLRGQLVVQSSTQGIFVYKGTPAAGNLAVAISSGPGTDSFGNQYGADITITDVTLGTGIKLYMADGQLDWHHAQFAIDPLVEALTAGSNADTPALALFSPTNDALGNLATAILLQGASADGTTSPGWVQLTGTNLNTGALVRALFQVVGQIVATDPSVTPGKTFATRGIEKWHIPALGSGWAAGPFSGTFQSIAYRIDAEDNLIIRGAIHTTSATPTATIFTLPTAWRPATSWRGPGAVKNDGGTPTVCFLEVDSSGAVSLTTNETVTAHDVYFMAVVPLGNLT